MKYKSKEFKDKLNETVILRNAEHSDASDLIEYLKTIAGESRFLINEPEEIKYTLEGEESFIKERIEAPKELMLIATIDGKHIGNCSLSAIGNNFRYSHRCEIEIALYKEYTGRGIGKIMLSEILKVAKEIGYEQVELEVMSKNTSAIALYEKLGFVKYGTFPDNMKYKDGTYDDAIWMMKKL